MWICLLNRIGQMWIWPARTVYKITVFGQYMPDIGLNPGLGVRVGVEGGGGRGLRKDEHNSIEITQNLKGIYWKSPALFAVVFFFLTPASVPSACRQTVPATKREERLRER
jgi:hypothetical protein